MTAPKCSICGEPMPAGEEMFKMHGYSGPCPKPPLPRATIPAQAPAHAAMPAERRVLREKLICAALTGMLSNPNVYGAPEHFAGLVIRQADAIIAALDREAAK